MPLQTAGPLFLYNPLGWVFFNEQRDLAQNMQTINDWAVGVHDHLTKVTGLEHVVATQFVSGFMSYLDKIKLDTIEANAISLETADARYLNVEAIAVDAQQLGGFAADAYPRLSVNNIFTGANTFNSSFLTVNSALGQNVALRYRINGVDKWQLFVDQATGEFKVFDSVNSSTRLQFKTDGKINAGVGLQEAGTDLSAKYLQLAGGSMTGSVIITKADSLGLLLRSGGTSYSTRMSIGRASDEFVLGIAAASNNYVNGTVAGDFALYNSTATAKIFIGKDASSNPILTVSSSGISGVGTGLTALNADNLGSGTVPLARISNLTDTQVSASAAISWAKISKTGSSLADLATRSASDLTSGTIPDARFPATLPALSGANLTALNASNLGSGTVPVARLPLATTGAAGVIQVGSNLTISSGVLSLASGNVTGALGYTPVNKAGDTGLGSMQWAGGTNFFLRTALSGTNSIGLLFEKSGTRHAGLSWDGINLKIIDGSHNSSNSDTWDTDHVALATFDLANNRVLLGIETDDGSSLLQVGGKGLFHDDVTVAGGDINLTNSASNRIYFNANGIDYPTFTARSAGTKIVLSPGISATAVDFAIGIASGLLWNSVPQNTNAYHFRWYGGTTQVMDLDGTGVLSVTGNIQEAGTLLSNKYLGINANAASATKLQTTRTISISGDATATGTFDGTGDLDLALAIADDSHWHGALKAVDDRDIKPNVVGVGSVRHYFTSKEGLTGAAGSDYQDLLVLNTYSDASGGKVNALAFDKSTQLIVHYQANQADTTWGTPKTLAYTDSNITGNAATATKLATSRTISLTGDVTGSGTFDGSGNLAITATVDIKTSLKMSGTQVIDASRNISAGNVTLSKLTSASHEILNGTDTWLRTKDATGWFSTTYGGGIHMSDSTWVRVYNNKAFWADNCIRATDFRLPATDGTGIQFWNGDNYKIYMSTDANATWGGGIDTDSTIDYNMYFLMSSYLRGFVWKGPLTNGATPTPLMHLTGNGLHTAVPIKSAGTVSAPEVEIKSTATTKKFRIEYNETEDCLDFVFSDS